MANTLKGDLLFGYDQMHKTHQPRTMFDWGSGREMEFCWDANGNLAQVIGCVQNLGRLHEWDEENRLRFVLGEKFAGYYGYDANGERVYKLTGISNLGQVNSGSIKAQAIFDDAVLYPNPFRPQGTVGSLVPTEDINGNSEPKFQYQCKPAELLMVEVLGDKDIRLQCGHSV